MASLEISLPDNCDAALLEYQKSLQTIDPIILGNLITMLWDTTNQAKKTQNEDGTAFISVLEMWTKKLIKFPADIVQDVLENWSDRPNGNWFPALADVIDAVKFEVKPRRETYEYLREFGSAKWARSEIFWLDFDLKKAKNERTARGIFEGIPLRDLKKAVEHKEPLIRKRISELKKLLPPDH